ncbi:DUF7117 family protein [Halocalculus aciditolerans]|uniref:TFIIB-type zinc ribbon-containing protein n=1 Tax=Halocalculus aciditolerans TaxID=1383812 RepID=A0A830F9Q7_9EURY|nr:TFIIB-type zinc ribbon-containing protein [Halocalculus aciditolerans]GGL53056.1 hypothetical protein GCM10009039_09100 [Halocalculus aciditolerans]
MEVRGRRECKACGAEWSYFETGSVECPECGSVVSVGVGERREHTDHAADLDLGEVLAARGERDVRAGSADGERGGDIVLAAEAAEEAARAYLRERGFVRGGELLDLDDTYLAAAELRFVAGTLARRTDVSEGEEAYFESLVSAAADGERPDASEVPDSLRDSRGLGYANAVRDYRQELREWGEETGRGLRDVLESLGDHVKRVRALDGDVGVEESEALVSAARAAADAARGDESGVERARDALSALA